MKIYITKYAITNGIKEVDARETSVPEMFEYAVTDGKREYGRYAHKGDYCLSREDAVIKATKMRDKRIASLKKQIRKLEQMDFQ